jgi:mRNA-degrading endonuclease RelE of RelBE toxin-antitoxin system
VYQVLFAASASDQLKRLEKPIAQRILYTANRSEQSLTIHHIGQRREIYKRPGN